MKKITALICTISIFCTLLIPVGGNTTAPPETREADIFDALEVLRDIVGLTTEPLCVEIYDVNENGEIEIFDALEILKSIVGLREEKVIMPVESDKPTVTTIEPPVSTTTIPPIQPPQLIPLSKEIQDQILTHWLRTAYRWQPVYDGTNARIALYLGTYNGNVVFVLDDIFGEALVPQYREVLGIDFEYGNLIQVWNGTQIRSLVGSRGVSITEWLTFQDIQAIHAQALVNPLPRRMKIENLPEQTVERIKEDFKKFANLREECFIWVSDYFGTYNDKVAIIMEPCFFSELTKPAEETIAGYTFWYANQGPFIRIWINGEFHRLQQAYDLKLITQDNLKNIHQRWRQRWGL